MEKGTSNNSCEVFISHPGTVKRGFVAWLNQALWTAGVRSFLDERGLLLGADADTVMEIECCTAKIIIFVLTPDFFTRKWTLQELHWALQWADRSKAKLYPIFYQVKPDEHDQLVANMTKFLNEKGFGHTQSMDDVKRLFRITGYRKETAEG